jgi:hypothetical protein
MLYRLTKKQQQESPRANENDTVAGVALLILCASIAFITSASGTTLIVDAPAFYMTMLGSMTLYFATSQPALDPRGVGSVPERLPGAAGNEDIYFETQHSALTDRKSANSSAFVIGEHTPDRLTLEPCKLTHRACFTTALIISTALIALVLGGKNTLSIWMVPAALKTALLLSAVVLLALIFNHLRQPLRRVIFDRNSGVFWVEQILLFNFKMAESAQMPLHQVVALQRVVHPRERHIGNGLISSSQAGSTQELNVVFRNRERVNIVCHEDCQALRTDATVISAFLQVPVWVSEPAENT